MEISVLEELIQHFDEAVKDIDFKHLPERDSEEYRLFVLKTSNDKVFFSGRYSNITEWTLEMFDRREVRDALKNVTMINALSDAQRRRLRFYLDLKETCYPLFKGYEVDWTAWPWNMDDGRTSLQNKGICDILKQDEYIYLSCAILFDMTEYIMREDSPYSSVAKSEVSYSFSDEITAVWARSDLGSLTSAMAKFMYDLDIIENHILIGQELGFDKMTQSIYDAIDTYIDKVYQYDQVVVAREVAKWIKDNLDRYGGRSADDMLAELQRVFAESLAEHNVKVPDLEYTMDIVKYDVFGIPSTRDWEYEQIWLDDDDYI